MNNKSGSEQRKCDNCYQPMTGIHSCDPLKMGGVISSLQKLCEEQKGEIVDLKSAVHDLGVRVLVKTNEVARIESQLATQTVEIERLQQELSGLGGPRGAQFRRVEMLTEELATQTERVRILEERLREFASGEPCCSHHEYQWPECFAIRARQALSHPTPPLYSAVVELVKVAKRYNGNRDIQEVLSTLKKLIGREQ